jgi:glycosyltransferase involved in cell wall biosynthesis
MKKSVLILCPHPSAKGGVANYYRLLEKYFESERVSLDFYYTGATEGNSIRRKGIYKGLYDLFSLMRLFPRYDLIIVNPSLDPKAVIRDGLFHFIARRIFRRKTLVFFRGWNIRFEQLISRYGKRLFNLLFNSDRILVLSKRFRSVLSLWGFDPQKIELETTTYEQYLPGGDKNIFKIVFLSRFSNGKGCLEAVQSVELLIKEHPAVKLYMVGEGELMVELQNYVINHNLKNHVEFTGWLMAIKISSAGKMRHHGISTNYGEGCPIASLKDWARTCYNHTTSCGYS